MNKNKKSTKKKNKHHKNKNLYLVTLSSNDNYLLSYSTLHIEYIDRIIDTENNSMCFPTNETSLSYIHTTQFIVTLKGNSTKSTCFQLK